MQMLLTERTYFYIKRLASVNTFKYHFMPLEDRDTF